jgi:hypothetical protein
VYLSTVQRTARFDGRYTVTLVFGWILQQISPTSAIEMPVSGRYGDRTQWLIHLDVDEFIIPEGEHESIPSVLRGYDDQPTAVLAMPMQVKRPFSKRTCRR